MNIFNFRKKLSKGGPIPHNDPPDFKPKPHKRIIPFGEHFLWIGGGTSVEYFINMKHMYLRNAGTANMMAIKLFLSIIIIPTTTITVLKTFAHDTPNYYRKEFTLFTGPTANPNNIKETVEKIKNIHSEKYIDPLGRKTPDYYKMNAPLEIRIDKGSFFDDHIDQKDDYIGKK